MTRISVVIPTYNRAGYVRETVESILAQTLAPSEVIIVDDGSTDNTPDVCAQFRAPVSYMRIKNAGPSAARNAGIGAAKGDWIALCDSDDVWEPQKLQLQMSAIAATKAGWCISEFRIIDPDGQPVRPGESGLARAFPVLKDTGVGPGRHFARWLDARQVACDSSTVTVYHGDLFGMLFLGNIVLPSTAIMSRALIERAGPFDPAYRRAEDTEFFHRLSTYAPGAIVMAPLARYRVGHPSIMTEDATPFIEYTLRSIHAASQRRPALTAAERTAFREGRRKLRLRMAYSRLASLDVAGAREALYQGWREGRSISMSSAAITLASFLPLGVLRGLHRAKRAIKQRLR